jgi:hypothetical protein
MLFFHLFQIRLSSLLTTAVAALFSLPRQPYIPVHYQFKVIINSKDYDMGMQIYIPIWIFLFLRAFQFG